MRCPVDSHGGNGIEVCIFYSNFLVSVEKFRKLDALPVYIKYEGENLVEVLYHKQVKWHKSSHLKFSSSKLMKVQAQQKRKLTECASREDQSIIYQPVKNTCFVLRSWAHDLQDTSLIAKLSADDLIAIEAKYHYNCFSAYKNRYRSFIHLQHSNVKCEDKQLLARAFAELVCYIENKIENDEHILKLSQLHRIYEEFFWKNCLLVFNEGLKKVLKEATTARDFEAEAFLITKLAKIMKIHFNFQVTFHTNVKKTQCLLFSVPSCLLLNGPHVQDQDEQDLQSSLTLLQLVCYNSKFRGKRSSTDNTCHFKGRETLLPLSVICYLVGGSTNTGKNMMHN